MNELLGNDPNGLFGLLFNLLIIVAVGGLWLMWARNLKRQKGVEGLLVATSAQLEEATRHLESALQEINRLQKQQEAKAVDEPPRTTTAATYSARAYRQAQHDAAPAEEKKPAPEAATAGEDKGPAPARKPSDAGNDVEQILRLHRMGKSADQIAVQANMPMARVNLLLRLHEQRSGGAKPAR